MSDTGICIEYEYWQFTLDDGSTVECEWDEWYNAWVRAEYGTIAILRDGSLEITSSKGFVEVADYVDEMVFSEVIDWINPSPNWVKTIKGE